jgi:hypothetical protein
MNPLLTQKIEWVGRLKIDEIVGERRQPIPGKGVRWWWFGEKGKSTRSLSLTLPRPAYAATFPRPPSSAHTNVELARSLRVHLRYFLLICTLFWSTHPPAIGKYYHYLHPRSKTVVAALQVRSTANGGGARFSQPGHPRWPGQVKTPRKLR